MSYINLIPQTITAGTSFTIPQGFFMASINPGSGASFTITNNLGQVSGSYATVFSFPFGISPSGWDQHIITATGGTVYVEYASGL
jgi:hypothetical protein